MSRLRATVTGGGGFLGSRIVAMLVAEGGAVTSFSRKGYPELTRQGVTCHTGDLADAAAVCAAVKKTDVVFHVAAKAGIWGDYDGYHAANVTGTLNVIDACRRNGVSKLVYTSTPSVVFRGDHVRNATESEPVAGKCLAAYVATKAEAERLVIRANSSSLATVALRPHLIWGPGDTQLFPRLVERHRAGRLLLVGSGDNLIDTTFVDNAARAHLNAAKRLTPGGPVAGKVYFISQGDPRPVRTMVNSLLQAAGLPPVTRSIPLPVAYTAAWILEAGYRLFRVSREPAITRFSVLEMARDHYFDISAARRDLGYQPSISIEEGLERLRSAFAAGHPPLMRARGF